MIKIAMGTMYLIKKDQTGASVKVTLEDSISFMASSVFNTHPTKTQRKNAPVVRSILEVSLS